MYVALAQVLTSDIIFQEITVAGVVVKALIYSRATTSCCSRHWYKQNQAKVGPLLNPQVSSEGEISLPHSWAIFSKLKNEDKDLFFF